MMSGSVKGLREAVTEAVATLEPDCLELADAEAALQEFSTIRKAAAAAEALLARRVTAAGVASRDAAASDADRLAARIGQAVGTARRMLDAARHLEHAPATLAAVRHGALSIDQAAAVAAAAVVAPAQERQLLAVAQRQPLAKLQEECQRVRSRSEDLEARQARVHRERYWRRWTDAEGARCGQYRLTADAAAVLEGAARPFVEAAFRAARKEGRREPAEAYAADGLVALATSAGAGPSGARVETTLLVNVESLHAGTVGEGEVCEIPGVGPVAVETARELLGPDALKLAIVEGVDVRTVVHLGRQPTAAQRTAIYVRDRGRCVRPPCGRPMREIDHVRDWATTHQTTFDDLAGLCAHDHDLKTHHGHTYVRGPSGWEWHRPDGTVEYERPPPPD